MELLPVTQSSSSSSWYLPYFRFPYFGCFLYPCLCGDTSHAVCNRSRNARASNRYNNAPDHRTEHDTTTRDRFSVRSESAPALTFITFVMVTDIAHALSRGSGDLQCKAHMPPISAATPVIIIERFCRNIVFHTEAPTEIRQIDRSIPIGISDKDGKPILCGQRASEYRKNSSKPIFS